MRRMGLRAPGAPSHGVAVVVDEAPQRLERRSQRRLGCCGTTPGGRC